MDLFIRRQQTSDIELLGSCLSDSEFISNIWGHKSITLDEFLDRYSYLNYVIGELSNIERPLGFFIIKPYNFEEDELNPHSNFFFYGGIRPCLFNSGCGIYLCSTMLHFFFDIYPASNLYANVFVANNRSRRMLLALGFKILRENCDSTSLRICRDEYLSSFLNQWINKKISYIVM
ncbi:MAG: GNAT family N-acetyltransferase [Muribaculaceae bacterium]|nr:GNAT family N-acetyltransferase [Muribaculaceae bacterium]